MLVSNHKRNSEITLFGQLPSESMTTNYLQDEYRLTISSRFLCRSFNICNRLQKLRVNWNYKISCVIYCLPSCRRNLCISQVFCALYDSPFTRSNMVFTHTGFFLYFCPSLVNPGIVKPQFFSETRQRSYRSGFLKLCLFHLKTRKERVYLQCGRCKGSNLSAIIHPWTPMSKIFDVLPRYKQKQSPVEEYNKWVTDQVLKIARLPHVITIFNPSCRANSVNRHMIIN